MAPTLRPGPVSGHVLGLLVVVVLVLLPGPAAQAQQFAPTGASAPDPVSNAHTGSAYTESERKTPSPRDLAPSRTRPGHEPPATTSPPGGRRPPPPTLGRPSSSASRDPSASPTRRPDTASPPREEAVPPAEPPPGTRTPRTTTPPRHHGGTGPTGTTASAESAGAAGATTGGPGPSGTADGIGSAEDDDPAVAPTGRMLRVLPLGTGFTLVGLGLAFLGIRLRGR